MSWPMGLRLLWIMSLPPNTKSQVLAAPAFLPALDGLRAIAVLLVLASHFPFMRNVPIDRAFWQAAETLRTGTVGVDLFFVLSGFLISRLLIYEKRKTGTIGLFEFYRRRAYRIFPIYYLSVMVCLIAFPTSIAAAGSLFLYVFNIYHAFNPAPYALEHSWSLSVEEQFYLVWPLALALLPLRFGRVVTLVVVPALALCAAAFLTLAFEPTLAAELIYVSLPTRMLSLSLGAYLAFREADGEPVKLPSALASIALGLALMALAFVMRSKGWLAAGGHFWLIALFAYALFAAGSVAAVVFNGAAFVSRLLATEWLCAIGRMSYGLYLYHLIILFALDINPAKAADGTTAALFLAAVMLTIGLATLSYHFVERPILAMRRRPEAAA